MDRGRVITIATWASIAGLLVTVIVLIEQLIDAKAKNASLQAQLNSLNADRDPGPFPYRNPTTPEERARVQAELDARNAKLDAGLGFDAKSARIPMGCHMLDGTRVASCAPGDSLCVCDGPRDW